MRALADVPGELLRVQRFNGPVLSFHAAHHQGLSVRDCNGCKGNFLGKRDELDADSAVRAHRHLFEREHQQPCVRGQGCNEIRVFNHETGFLNGNSRFHLHEILALPGLGDQVAELAHEAKARRAVHEELPAHVAGGDPDDVVGGVDQGVHRRAVAAAGGNVGSLPREALARCRQHDDRVGGLAFQGLQQRVAVLEAELRHIEGVAGARADPALLRQDHGDRLLDHGALDLGPFRLLDQGPSCVAVFLRVLLQFRDHQLLQLFFIVEQRPFPVVVQLHPVQLGQLAEPEIDDVLRLPFAELEFLLQLVFCVLLILTGTNQPDDFIYLQVREQPP